MSAPQFGKPMLKHWMFNPDYKNLNHGSFGAHPIPVRDAQRAYMDLADQQPDPYIRRHHSEHLTKAREAVAKLLNAQRSECVFVKNATTGVATVLYNLAFQPGEALIYFEPVYGAVEKGVVSLQEHSPLQARKVSFQFPITEDELERRFREVIRRTRDEGLKVRASVFDGIVSNPGVRFPFERITAVCREEGILSVIDAAHGIGQIHLDMQELQPDFFVSNCHKYVFPLILHYFPGKSEIDNCTFCLLIPIQMALYTTQLCSSIHTTPQPALSPHHITNIMGIHPKPRLTRDNRISSIRPELPDHKNTL